MTECCTFVVPPGSVLAKFKGQKIKIATVLEFVMKGSIDTDEKKLKTRKQSRRCYLRRKDRLVTGKHAPTPKEAAAL